MTSQIFTFPTFDFGSIPAVLAQTPNPLESAKVYDLAEFPTFPFDLPPIAWIFLVFMAIPVVIGVLYLKRKTESKPSLQPLQILISELTQLASISQATTPGQQPGAANRERLEQSIRLVREFLSAFGPDEITSLTVQELAQLAENPSSGAASHSVYSSIFFQNYRKLLLRIVATEELLYGRSPTGQEVGDLILSLKKQVQELFDKEAFGLGG